MTMNNDKQHPLRRAGAKMSDRLYGVARFFAVVFLVLIVVLLLREAAGRSLPILSSLRGAHAWTGMLMAAMLTISLPFAIRFGPVIEVDMVYRLLPSLIQNWVDVVRGVLVLGFFAALGVSAVPWAFSSMSISERRAGAGIIPLYPIKVLFAAGLCLVSIVTFFVVVRAVKMAVTKGRVRAESIETEE